MRRTVIAFALASAAVLALVMTLTARNRDRSFEAFTRELDAVTDEMVGAINANPTAAGIVRAREILDAKKDVLKAKLAGLKSLTAGQAGGERLALVEKALVRNSAKINDLFEKEIDRRKQELGQLRERVNESKRVADDPAVTKAQQENRQFVEEMRRLLGDYKSVID